MGARAHKTIENAPAQDQREDTTFLKAIGERVRKVRQQRNITRKALADRSGVSERYLAQLESGLGNVSVLVLRDVALALDLPADALLRDANEESPEIGLIQQLLRRMTPQRLAQARELLLRDLRDHPQERSSRIALVGLRGAGKTTLGEKLAQSLQRPFVELDREIEREAGTGLSEIFLLYGQQGYRRYERRCLEHILGTGQACVIATGGSIVSEPSTFKLLLSTCFTVWLKATPEEHMQRVIAQGDMRPMAGRAQAMDDLRRILESRTGLYARADATVNTAGKNVRQALSELKQLAMRK